MKDATLIWMNKNSDYERSGPSWITSSLRHNGAIAHQRVSALVVDILSTVPDYSSL